MATEPTEEEKCAAITEAAIQTAMDRCGDDAAVKKQMGRLLGFDGEPDVDCSSALSEGLNDETLQSPNGTRQWVFCNAWQLVESNQADTLSQALERSWAEVEAEEQASAV